MTETFHAGPNLGRLSDVTIIHGDCIEAMRELADDSIDAIVCDPPYGLEFMGKEWDGADGFRRSLNPADVGRDNAFGRASRTSPEYRAGHLFQEWSTLWCVEALRVLKPGGHLLAFGGTRTWHRLAVAVEDAGFEIRDSIAWLYGSGFPKSLDVSKAIDKMDAAEERRSRALEFTAFVRGSGLTAQEIDRLTGTNMGGHYLTTLSQPAIATADLFDMLRPHLPEVPERIEELVRQRTVESKDFAARRVTGVQQGAMAGWAMDGTTKFVDRNLTEPHTPEAEQWQGWGTALKPAFEPVVVGRKPFRGTVAANVLAHGTGALNIDGCRIGAGTGEPKPEYVPNNGNAVYGSGMGGGAWANTAGRWPANVVLDESQAAALDEQSGTSTAKPHRRNAPKAAGTYGAFAGDDEQRDGPSDSGGASRFFYCAKAPKKERPVTDEGISHATVKPLTLMRWLVRLVTPPGGVVLDPFAGSGTTVEAALLEGFRVIGIERETDYLPMIQQRIARCLNS
jgi:DNA modification methylase